MEMGKLQIFVCDRGRVLVGVPQQDAKDWFTLVLTHCAIVRKWGTTAGLGQLAAEGPRPETTLDLCPDGTTLNKRYVMETNPCNERAWAKYLKGSR